MRITFLSLVTLFIGFTGTSKAQENTVFAKNDKNKIVAEEIVAVVGNYTISMSDLYAATQVMIENRKEYGVNSKLQPAEEALELLLTQKLLATFAKLDSLDKDMPSREENVQKRVDEMVRKAGSLKELEKMNGKPIFQIREDLKRDIQEGTLSQLMNQKIREGVSITHSEVEDFFRTMNADSMAMVPPQISYAQIVKMPPNTEERTYEVRQRLLEFRERIINGEKMAVLARLYSQDPGSKSNGGLYTNIQYEQFIAPFVEAVKQLNPGQISEIVESEYGFHIIELVSKNEITFDARHILLKPEFTVEEETKASKELDSVANLIREKKLTFAEAAFRYSDDVETRMNGGQLFNIDAFEMSGGDMREASTKFVMDQIRNPIDNRVLSNMKVGDVSDPYQNMDKKGNIVYKIVSVTDNVPAHKVNMIDDFVAIENLALYSKQEKAIDKWIDEAIGKVYIHITPEYMNYNMVKEAWKIQSEKCKSK